MASPRASEDLLIIGFDAEWVLSADKNSRHILSYQYAGRCAKGEWSGIIYTKGLSKKDRIRFVDLSATLRLLLYMLGK